MVPRSIAEVTAESCIFLTGVTGFVGGCLLDRICRMDPDPARVFVLVREKHKIEPKFRLKKILASSESNMSLKDLEQKYGALISKHPNTYSFTKKLIENLLVREKVKIPLAIVRPGIILDSWREPFPGWVDNVNSGACGFIAGAVKGIFCTFQASNSIVMDVILVDMVVSTILAAALKAEQEPKKLHVFHSTSGTINPTTSGYYYAEIIRALKNILVGMPPGILEQDFGRIDSGMNYYINFPYVAALFERSICTNYKTWL